MNMKTTSKRFIFIAAVLVGVVAVDQSGFGFSFSRSLSSTHNSERLVSNSDLSFKIVSIEYPWTRWIPLVKFGETVIQHEYRWRSGSEHLCRASVTKTSLVALGFMSIRQYESLARKDFETVSAEYKRLPNQSPQPNPQTGG